VRGTRIEKKVEVRATNITNKTKCMSTNAKKWAKKWNNVKLQFHRYRNIVLKKGMD
jgi:hypothetical protein